MKFILTSALCLCAFLLFSDQQACAQTVPETPPVVDFFPLDTYGNISTRDENARLDNLAISLRQAPEQVAYIFVYAGKMMCMGEVKARITRITNYLVKTRGVETERLTLRDGGYREEAAVDLFLWPRVSEFGPPSAAPTVDAGEVRVRSDCKRSSRHRRGGRNSRKQ